MIFKTTFLSLVCGSFLLSGIMFGKEFPIGEPKVIDGIQYTAVYLKAQGMAPKTKHLLSKENADLHLELDIKAYKDEAQKFGFNDGDWIPYLQVKYSIQKIGGKKSQKGTLMTMVADDGPHYGKNIKLNGPGKYKITYNISKLDDPNSKTFLYRHTDKESGVAEFPKAVVLEYEFEYTGNF